MTTNLTQIVDAISNKQFNAAQDMLSDAIQEKLSDSLIARKDEVALDFGQEVTNEEKDYDAFFQKAMKKFGISSPADLKTDEKKKEFFNYIDDNFKAKNEDRHPDRTDAGSDLPKIVGSYPLGNKDGRQYILDPSTFEPIAPYRGAPAERTSRRRGGELA